MSKNFIFIILLLILCSTSMIAQTSYYYYKGEKIPLSLNNSKLCVSIPKTKGDVSKELMKGINVLDTIKDEAFDISIIQQADFKKMSSSKVWGKEENTFLVSPCYITKDRKEVFLTPYLNVRLKRKQDLNLLLSYAEKYGLTLVRHDSLMPMWYILSISTETGMNALDVANALWESGDFMASVPDLCLDNLVCSVDPLFNQQWGLYNGLNPGIDISATEAWNYSTGKNVKIAIIDTGVDMTHIDLAPNISSLSYDTETGTSPSVRYGRHATHCAGIASAVKDNGIQIAGVAPEATIISISNSFMSPSPNAEIKLADGIMWAYQHGADIISNSWHCLNHEAIDEAIENAFRYGRHGKGCVVVFSAGNTNGNSITYPANSNDTILVVGAINRQGKRAIFSSCGAELDLVAPGDSILSTFPNDSIGYDSGTSMACPHVAGVAALVLERNSELSVTQVNSIINSTAKKNLPNISFHISKPDGMWNAKFGYGLVDAYGAVLSTPSTAYIQNENVTGERTISADSIIVGKDVTNDKAYGNVTLGPGEITMKAKFLKIKNSTSIPLGTKLKTVN